MEVIKLLMKTAAIAMMVLFVLTNLFFYALYN